MTINVALVTSEALVFGCDSIASTTEYFLPPFELVETDDEGKVVFDDEQRATVRFKLGDLQPLVTNAWSGVTKMFQISDKPAPVVVVTAGAAKLNDRTMASLGAQFRDDLKTRKKTLVSVEPIAKAFLRFFRRQYEQHYAGATMPEEYRPGPEFLVGGYGRDVRFPMLFRVKVRENVIVEEFSNGTSGVAWNGQSDAVERVLNGFDSTIANSITQHYRELLDKHRDDMKTVMLNIISEILKDIDAEVPRDIDAALPDKIDLKFSFDQYRINTDFSKSAGAGSH